MVASARIDTGSRKIVYAVDRSTAEQIRVEEFGKRAIKYRKSEYDLDELITELESFVHIGGSRYNQQASETTNELAKIAVRRHSTRDRLIQIR